MTNPTPAQIRAWCSAAGLNDAEYIEHPQHGIIISAAGARKLAAIAADDGATAALMAQVSLEEVRTNFRKRAQD